MANRVSVLLAVALLVVADAIPDRHKTRDLLEKNPVKDKRQISDIRLVGTTQYAGRLEVNFQSEGWGTVCDDDFDGFEARVVCRMLGFSGGEVADRSTYIFGTGTIVMDDVVCRTGQEPSLWNCEWNPNHNCDHTEDVGVRCDGPATGSVRLVGGTSPREGRLEVFHSPDGWGTVCDDWFESADAEVACRMLGFSEGEVARDHQFGEGAGEILLGDVECSGSEESLLDCDLSDWKEHDCDHSEDVGLICGVSDNEVSSVRLVGSASSHEGRVEVLYNGEWGTICDDWWEDVDASVVCRQLGMTGGEAFSNAEFGMGVGTILLDAVQCDGDESDIAACSHGDWGINDCTHSEDAAVRCDEDTTESVVLRLVGGASPNEGRVEVYHNGQIGNVCDDGWRDVDATVVCRQLGMTGGEAWISVQFGFGTRTFLLDNVQCDGSESSIAECSHNGWGIHDCYYTEVAGVRCDGGTAESTHDGGTAESTHVRLVGGASSYEGRVEVYHDGEWGTVCDDLFDEDVASVVCRELGMSGRLSMVFSGARFGRGTGPILLDNVDCDDTESSITECSHRGWGVHDCSHSEDVGVRCGRDVDVDSYRIRLANGNSPNEGRVEILHNGEWGTVCDDYWGNEDATVVCRSLGYSEGVAFDDNEFGSGSGMIWLDNVGCVGTEDSLYDCRTNAVGNHDCTHYEDAGVSCS